MNKYRIQAFLKVDLCLCTLLAAMKQTAVSNKFSKQIKTEDKSEAKTDSVKRKIINKQH